MHESLKTHFKGYLIGRGYFRAYRALTICIQRHTELRKDGITPYWSHPLSVAAYLRTLFGGTLFEENLIITALLHDILEDTEFKSSDIMEEFGNSVLNYVDSLTKIKGELTEVYYERVSKHSTSALVKAADRIHNLNTMIGAFDNEKMLSYIQETEDYVLPMIKRCRDEYPQDEAAYENMKLIIHNNVLIIRSLLK